MSTSTVHDHPATPRRPWRPERSRSSTLSLVLAAVLAVGALTIPAPSAQAVDVPLSQGKAVTVSSLENANSNPGSAAVDGSTATRWSSAAADGQWIQVDLGARANVTKVVLQWEAAYASGYTIQTSDDASTWTAIHTTVNGTGGTETLNVTGSGRYLRVQSTKRATGYGISLWELQVFGTPAGATTGTCGTMNIAQGKAVTASTSEGPFVATAATDGDLGTRWASASADQQWLQVDLGSSQQVCRVVLSWEAAYGKAFRVQTSADGTTWATAATVTDGVGGTQTITVSATARYLRLDLQQRATGYGFSLWEVAVNTVGAPNPGDPGVPGPADGKVRVDGTQGNWRLLVNGQPYTVKGMTWGPAATAFNAYADKLTAMGVNTIRTWGTDASSKTLLDDAAAHGVRVVAGFWLGPGGGPGSGGCPNYVTDDVYKAAVMNDITTWTTAYKDNPGVLMWDVGNESLLGLQNCYGGTELEAQRNAYATFVNDAAKKIHLIDPTHPVTTTDAWTGAWVYLKRNAPDLDLYGLNSYNAVCDAKQTWIDGNYDKPYIITEGGPAGEWEVPNDANGIPDQGTDVQNAAGYTKAWGCIKAHPGVALGATLFHFGIEGDFGGIWFNVLPGGNKRLSYYAIANAYGAPTASNTPPVFTSMDVPGSGSVVAGSTFTVNTAVSDPNGDALTYSVLLNSNYINKAGGLAAAEFTRSGNTYQVTAPPTLGVWKVYVFAEDGHGNVGVETRSFRVVPPAMAGTNIALGRPATASSFDPWNGNFAPGQATDGNLATRWSSGWTDNEWIQVDLGSVRTFSKVQLVWEAGYGKGYRIQASDDAVTWRDLATVTDGDGNVDIVNAAGSGRYVRMQGTQRGTAWGYSLFELGVYAS